MAQDVALPRERRLTEQLILYWNEKRGERSYPSAAEIKPAEIPKLWPDCFLVSVAEVAEHPEHNYVYIGDNIKANFGGHMQSESVLPIADNLASQYYLVLKAQKPLIQETQFNDIQDQEVRYRQILLPLGPEEGKVDHVLGGLRCTIVPSNT